MRVFIQNLENGGFMNAVSQWGREEEAYDFRTPAFAIDLCMMRGLQDVRVIVNWGEPERNIFLDVHASDAKALRTGLSESRDLRGRQRKLRRELDAARAEGKEKKKQFPFWRRKRIADQ
jgi:hypothetical protein